MIIKQIQLLSEALWESVKVDLKFFSSIQLFVKRLAESDFTDSNSLPEITMCTMKIEEFFDRYRKKPNTGFIYIPPGQTSHNDSTVKSIKKLVDELNSLPRDQMLEEFDKVKPKPKSASKGFGEVFIGHGRSKLWARLQIFLNDELNLKTLVFENESRTSETIVNILDDFLNRSSIAILVMTAEDDTADGKLRARQNVIHEAGLFQGRLGFDKVIILKQEGLDEFSNIAGLQYIPFSGDNIEQCFYELGRKFKKLGMVK